MLIGVRMMAGDESVDGFKLVHEAIGHQKIQRTVHGRRRGGARAIAAAHAIQQVVSLDRLTSVGDQLQYMCANRGQPQAALTAGALDCRDKTLGIIDVMLGGRAVVCVLAHT